MPASCCKRDPSRIKGEEKTEKQFSLADVAWQLNTRKKVYRTFEHLSGSFRVQQKEIVCWCLDGNFAIFSLSRLAIDTVRMLEHFLLLFLSSSVICNMLPVLEFSARIRFHDRKRILNLRLRCVKTKLNSHDLQF